MERCNREDEEIRAYLESLNLLVTGDDPLQKAINDGLVNMYRKAYNDGYGRCIYDIRNGGVRWGNEE